MSKRIAFGFLSLILCISLVGCGGGTDTPASSTPTPTVEPTPNILEGNYYFGSWNSEYANNDGYAATVKFSPDGVLEWVHHIESNNFSYRADKYYGSYELDGNLLTITLFLTEDITISCVVHDEGESITISGETFDKTLLSLIGDRTMALFDD